MTGQSNNESSKTLVLVTGASGFIDKHTIKALLSSGYQVRGTVRNEEEASIVRNAFSREMEKDKQLTLVTTDLLVDEGWAEAVQGCRFVVHLASPYPLGVAPDRTEIIHIAKQGSIRVVQVALNQSSVERVVVTSSVYAMMYPSDRRPGVVHLKEDQWTEVNDSISGYPASKTLAERAIWELAEQFEAKHKIVVVNPAMVWGPMYDNVLSTSSDVARLFFQGSYPIAPTCQIPIVDVRDVAALIVESLTATNVGGRRLLASAGSMSLLDIGPELGKAFPFYANKMPRYRMPNWLARLLAHLDPNIKAVVLDLGYHYQADSTYVTKLTGVQFRPASKAVCAMAQSLVDQGHIAEKTNTSRSGWIYLLVPILAAGYMAYSYSS